MTMPTSRLAYYDCYEILDKAIDSPRGIRLRFATEGAARHFRTRLHKARQINRLDNAETYDPSHALHGRSEYDPLTVKLRPNGEGWVLEIEPLNTSMEIEEIEE